ncbi:MAG: peptidoglycan-binding protein [Rubrivivax sp.]|nr:peptidoglycan-binding protein [Rubrivivax sp.]
MRSCTRASRAPGPSRASHRPLLGPALLLLAQALWALPAAAAAPQATVTFTEGDSLILSAGRAFVVAPGVRLGTCDALRTGPGAMVQVEFADGSAILLGPETRFVFDLPTHGATATQFLHSGWAKITAPQRANAIPYVVQTPSFDLSVDNGIAVLRMTAGITQAYVETGAAAALDAGGRVTPVRAGVTYTRKADQPAGSMHNGAEPDLARTLPRPLRDTLPMRLARLKDRDVRPQPAAAAPGADEWLTSSPELRVCSADDAIRQAQEALARKGFDVGPIDGVLGSRTKAALRAFQVRSGLPPSGQLDPETRRALDSASSR